ncbi:hypothetical protein BC830DRAFT_1159374 [Chytriomyces sp. MP71]|nr:hypothetical protein BC830DRAFT_1159374 [Chytriomyces sp. MP71]
MNLYLFRHMITGKVVVSPKFQLESKLLSQIGEQRQSLQIRPDHFVPFSVVTGLRSASSAQTLLTKLAPNLALEPRSKTTLPLRAPPSPPRKRLPKGVFGPRAADKADEWVGWTVPEPVKSASKRLCEALNEENGDVIVHWERDEFRRCADNAGLVWPQNVAHKQLELFRNRFPLVPGLDRKTWTDVGEVCADARKELLQGQEV